MTQVPPLVTASMIYSELMDLKKKVDSILENKAFESIEEISLFRASKLLRLSKNTIIGMVESGKLNTRIYKDNQKNKRYRFRMTDIRDFQTNKNFKIAKIAQSPNFIPAEEIANRIFGGDNGN